MTDGEILSNAIDKAIAKGYEYNKLHKLFKPIYRKEEHIMLKEIYMVIFSHSFAKAFWGEDWQYHLQQIVLKKNPLKYLERFL